MRHLLAALLAVTATSAAPTLAASVDVTGSTSPYPVTGFDNPAGSVAYRAIGIYEASHVHGGGSNPRYDAVIEIGAQATPLYLALSAYEPVNWVFKGAGVAQVKGVLVGGYNQHSWSGISSSLVTDISNLRLYTPSCYSVSNCGDFLSVAESQFGLKVDSLTGTYNANAFLVNATATGAVPEPAAWAMLIAGFGLVGTALRHRGRQPLAAA